MITNAFSSTMVFTRLLLVITKSPPMLIKTVWRILEGIQFFQRKRLVESGFFGAGARVLKNAPGSISPNDRKRTTMPQLKPGVR